jgi:hypothetical protein
VISGPSTFTSSQLGTLNGNPGGTVFQSFATQCLTDSFSATGNGGSSPPVICGTNTGYHSKPGALQLLMYCDAFKMFKKFLNCVTQKYFFFWVSASIQVDKNKNKLATLKGPPV